MPHTLVNGINLYWERVGDTDGPPVLFVSGSGGDLRGKPSMLEGPLSDGFDLLGYDQRGLGRSDKPDQPYAMADYAADAARLVDATVGWGRYSVVGASFGGMVAQELALLVPDRIERLVLCCTSSGGAGGSSYPLHELEPLEGDAAIARSISLADTRTTPEWLAAHPQVFELSRARTVAQPDDPAAAMGARRQIEARAGHDTYDRLPALPMPVLVCAGRFDGIAPVANSEALVSQIPNAELAVFKGGHLFLGGQEAWPVITKFLRA
jgi:3-oxoadipate enol-lactonase